MLDLIGKAKAITLPNLTPFETTTTGLDKPETLVVRIITILVYFAGALALGYMIYGGIMYITAGGDAEKATKGRTAVINAVIGIIIVLLALVIISWVTNAITEGV